MEYALLRAIVGGVRAMPTDFAISFMGKMWELIAPRLHRHQRALEHLSFAMPELSEAQKQAILKSMWKNLGMAAAETMMLDRLMADKARFEIADPDFAEKIFKMERAVLVSLHMGNWELVTAPLTMAGRDVAGVYQRIRNPLVMAYMHRMRERIYTGGLYVKGHEAAYHLMRQLKNGFAGILADVRDSEKLKVPFFGQPAPSTPFPAILALAHEAPLLAARTIRTGPGRFRVEAVEIQYEKTGNKQADIEKITASIQAQFETWVRQTPEQWMWAHKRWSHK